MAKKRTSIPKRTSDAVLKEFGHRCAVCCAEKPQLHHIDEDPSNQDPANLLPLCPNCHLGSEHDPSSGIGAGRLSLLRQFKEPKILVPQFVPLYSRLTFLADVQINEESVESLTAQVDELIGFVQSLEKGSFYAAELRRLLEVPKRYQMFIAGGGRDSAYGRTQSRQNREYREQLKDARDSAILLVIEQLKYQPWPLPEQRRKQGPC